MNHLIPQFIFEQLQAGRDHGTFAAVTLFQDISGFTAMSQALMRHGKAGAELLADVINRVFEPLTTAVYARGGWITGFAGDAFTAVFPGQTPAAALAAAETAVRIRQLIAQQAQRQTRFGAFSLTVKQGISAGEVAWGVVGPAAH
ncbi:MAG: hypothetical protein KC425_02240, partial [Anaerolineales bacterium]|nr:hypothetical protein [Anaerolineales bacterium]